MQDEAVSPHPGCGSVRQCVKYEKYKKGYEAMQYETPQMRYDSRYVANRIARAVGHAKLVKNMVEADADCTEVLIQLAAVRSALSSTAKVILKDHLEHCISEDGGNTEEQLRALNDTIDKFMQ